MKSSKAPFMYFNVDARPRPFLTPQEAERLGFKLMTYGVTETYVVTKALVDVYEKLKRTGDTGLNTREVIKETDQTKQLIEDLIDLPKYYEVEKRTVLRQKQ